jgi:hypothetical protein
MWKGMEKDFCVDQKKQARKLEMLIMKRESAVGSIASSACNQSLRRVQW